MNMPTKEELLQDMYYPKTDTVRALLEAIADGRLVVCEADIKDINGRSVLMFVPATSIPGGQTDG